MTTQTTEKWNEFFDAWAGQDPLVASTGEPSNPEELAAVAGQLCDWMELSGGQRVLDVGCASATLTSLWAHAAREVVGVDFSRPLLQDAERMHGGANLSFVHADAAALPFDDDQFDAVCTYAMMLCLPDHDHVERSMDELLRVANDGARIVIGGLPDTREKDVFFDHCDAMTPWYRRAVPRSWRWMAKRILKPGCTPGETAILWFDVEALTAKFQARGYRVTVEHDPELSNYAVYRKTLILQKEATR